MALLGPTLTLLPVLLLAPAAPSAPTAPAMPDEEFRLAEDDTWVQTTTVDPATPAGQLAVARRALAAGQNERAEYLATGWIERHGRDPLLAEAHLIRGDSLLARRSYYEALFDYEYVARSFAGSEAFVAALERELEIAKRFASGTRRKLWGMRIINASDEAEELLIRVQERLPGSRLAEDAGMTLADFYFGRRRMALAAEMYAIFIENYPRSERIATARKRLIYAHLASFKGPEFDAAGLYEARAGLQELKVTDPATAQQMGADALLTRIDESNASKLLETARWYMKVGDPIAAELAIRRLVRTYPRSVATTEAMRLVPDLLGQLPASQLAEAPDYEVVRAAVLGGEAPPPGSTRSRAPAPAPAGATPPDAAGETPATSPPAITETPP